MPETARLLGLSNPRAEGSRTGREVLRWLAQPHILNTARAQLDTLLLEIAKYAEEWFTGAQAMRLADRFATNRTTPQSRLPTRSSTDPVTRVIFWTERLDASDEQIALTWYRLGEPFLVDTQPNSMPGRPYGMCTVLIPALGARLTRNGIEAEGRPWPRDREGRPSSTCVLGLCESWTSAR